MNIGIVMRRNGLAGLLVGVGLVFGGCNISEQPDQKSSLVEKGEISEIDSLNTFNHLILAR